MPCFHQKQYVRNLRPGRLGAVGKHDDVRTRPVDELRKIGVRLIVAGVTDSHNGILGPETGEHGNLVAFAGREQFDTLKKEA